MVKGNQTSRARLFDQNVGIGSLKRRTISIKCVMSKGVTREVARE